MGHKIHTKNHIIYLLTISYIKYFQWDMGPKFQKFIASEKTRRAMPLLYKISGKDPKSFKHDGCPVFRCLPSSAAQCAVPASHSPPVMMPDTHSHHWALRL